MNTQHKPTYISLFSSAGVGCYGFKMAGFDCIATNELLERRLNIQRYNQKCKYPGGYICGDITQEQTKKLLYDQLELWKAKEHLSRVDVVIATPPCQGMSIANQKRPIQRSSGILWWSSPSRSFKRSTRASLYLRTSLHS